MTRTLTCAALCSVLLLVGPTRVDAVVISEIHYNPAGGSSLEFVELYNPGSASVSIAGWQFSDGVSYTFPEGAAVDAGGRVVICSNRNVLAAEFGLAADGLFGDYEGQLSNGGETLTLVDSDGVLVDSVRYDDVPPWGSADGTGSSLERVCASFSSQHPANWVANDAVGPTPLAAGSDEQCPPPAVPPPSIAINEISYHPVGEKDELEEFVELRNNTDQSINLKGYSFTDGINFTFEEDTVVDAGGFVVVCRNREHMSGLYSLENAVGDFTGRLSNDGERITLVDADGRFVDSVRYHDSGDWPVSADGQAPSLEKLIPEAVSDDPASWSEAIESRPEDWTTVRLTGLALSSSTIIRIYVNGEGSFLVDNLVLERTDSPGVNLLPNGSFDEGTETWEFRGTHEGSEWVADGGADGSGAVRIISTGRGSSTNSMRISLDPPLEKGVEHSFTFDYKYVSGATDFNVRFSGSSPTRGIFFRLGEGSVFSPGRENARQLDHLPPFVERIGRFPKAPKSGEPVWITARVRAERALAGVALTYQIDGTGDEISIAMADDGAHRDAASGDGIFGVELPPQEHNTIVTFRITAEDETGSSTTNPLESDPTGVHGFYVNDLQVESPLPVYTILWNHRTPFHPRQMRGRLSSCSVYQAASFAVDGELYYNVGLRRRGGSVCGDGNVIKPYVKIKFNRGRLFENQRKINIQSIYTDKSLIREKMAWEMFDELGSPTCREYFARLHLNGAYYGLHAILEHPDKRYLERNNLNPDGNLYKATASREEVNGTYEKKTNEHIPNMDDLRSFLREMHDTPRPSLSAFFTERMDADRVIDYQLAQTLMNNSDYPHKNHYLYHDTEKEKWMVLAWDLDLSFGKRWDGSNGGVLHDRMHTPGNNPWYTTSVDGGGGNELLNRFFALGGTWFRRAYIVRLWDAIQEKYTEEFFEEKIQDYHALLIDEQQEDIELWGRSRTWPDDRNAPAEFEPNLDRVRAHIRARREYLLGYLRSRHQFEGHDRLKITEVMYNPAGPAEDLEWIEIWNPNESELDLQGYSIEGIGFEFPEGASAPAGSVFIVAKNPDAFRDAYGSELTVFGGYDGNLDNNGEILRLKDAGPEYPATVDFLRYGTDDGWPAEADGLGYSIELTDVSVDRDNDLARYWARSGQIGGSPGSVPGVSEPESRFRRGDVNADGRLNVTDPITILGRLFRGVASVPCEAAMDVDGEGGVQLTDAVVLLNYLFSRDPPVIPAPGPRDCRPVSADRCRTANCAVDG